MKIVLVGINHEMAGVAVRECVAVAPHELAEYLETAAGCEGVDEALILCTCNRSELYMVVQNGQSEPRAQDVFARVHQVSPEIIEPYCYVMYDADAVAHMFRVAAGADSMVLGETEIIGQLRQALQCAREVGTAGRTLSRLGEKALSVGKRVRNETQIGRGCMSIASVAAGLALQIFDDLTSRRVLVVGAGEMGALVARRMVDCGARDVTIISRTRSRAQALAGEIGGRATGFDQFVDELMRADIVIASTSSPHAIVTVERVEAGMGRNRTRPILLIDLAVPRDVDPAVRAIDDVYLYDMDDLQQFVQSTEEQRACELPLVEEIAAQEARDFLVWAMSQEITPLVLEVLQQAEAVRAQEVARLQESVPELTRKAEKAIHLMSKRLVRRLMAQPLERIRRLASEGISEHDLRVIADLLAFEDAPESPPDAEEAPDE